MLIYHVKKHNLFSYAFSSKTSCKAPEFSPQCYLQLINYYLTRVINILKQLRSFNTTYLYRYQEFEESCTVYRVCEKKKKSHDEHQYWK